jgi:IPT/TIG domain
MRSANLLRGRAVRLTLAAAIAAGAVVSVAAPSQAATSKTSLSPATGQGLAGATATATPTGIVAVTGSGFMDAGGTSMLGVSSNTGTITTIGVGASAVQFTTATSCPAVAAMADGTTTTNVLSTSDTNGTGTVPTYTVVSATRLIVTVPSLPLTNNSGVYSSKAYTLCVYDKSSGTNVGAAGTLVLGSATYTVYPQPTVTSITPPQGSIVGGNTITVVGTNLTAKTSATLNGVALSGIKVAKDLKSFTAVVPPTTTIPKIVSKTNLGGSAYGLLVSTEGGPSSGAVTYTYVNAVTASPKLALVAGGTIITVTGKGFNTILNPTIGTPTANAKVLLIPGGAFNSTQTVATYDDWPWKSGSATGYNDASLLAAFECTAVKVVSDTELTCKTPALATGSYNVTLVDNYLEAGVAGTTFNYETVPSSSATVTVAAF